MKLLKARHVIILSTHTVFHRLPAIFNHYILCCTRSNTENTIRKILSLKPFRFAIHYPNPAHSISNAPSDVPTPPVAFALGKDLRASAFRQANFLGNYYANLLFLLNPFGPSHTLVYKHGPRGQQAKHMHPVPIGFCVRLPLQKGNPFY